MTRFRPGVGLVLLLVLAAARPAAADDRYDVTGMVLAVRAEGRSFVASIDAIPGFMAAMAMPFNVRDVADLEPLTPGAMVRFTLVVGAASSWAEEIRVFRVENLEQERWPPGAWRCSRS